MFSSVGPVMRRTVLMPTGFAVCIVSVALLPCQMGVHGAQTGPPAEQEVARLIDRLGGSNFAMRESASRSLLQFGEKALDALRRAGTSSADPEVRSRASALAREIAWDLYGGEERCLAHEGVPSGLAWTADGRQFLSSSGRQLFLWDLRAGKVVRRFTARGNDPVAGLPAVALALSPDDRRALTVSGSAMHLWELSTGRELHAFTIPKPGWFKTVAFAAGGQQALTADTDRIRLWDLATGRQVDDRRPHQTEIGCAACDRDGRWILSSGTGDGIICLTDMSKRNVGQRLNPGKYNWVLSAAFTGSGQKALLSTTNVRLDQGELSLWDLSTGTPVYHRSAGREPISAIAIAADGRRALTGGVDKMVRLWDLEAGRELHRFTGHTARVGCVAFSRDGRYGLSGGWDGSLRVWKLPRIQPTAGTESKGGSER
jgi:WD40 repeat protein